MIAEGVSPDEPRREKSQELPLLRAAQKGHVDTVVALIEAGADLNGTDKFGDTALDWSVDTTLRGEKILRAEVIKVLIQKGVRGSRILCAYAESEEELGLLEMYLEMRRGEYDDPKVTAREVADDGDAVLERKPSTMAEELSYCEERRNSRTVSPGDARPNATALRRILDKFRGGVSQASAQVESSRSDNSREEL